MPSIYALLVGINSYPISPLSGCINDLNAVDEFLQKTYGNTPGLTLRTKRITDQDETQPTRDNIIAGFDHFKDAGDGDTCFFYYSGHGSFVPAPPEFWLENDMKSESFVCIDSRVPGGKDLLDKEMGFLIWKAMAGKKNTRMVVITDCCHSGSITRDIDNSGIRDRMMPDAAEAVPLEKYLGFRTEINGVKYFETVSDAATSSPRAKFRQGNHIHISASRDNQTAKELSIDGHQRGAFTHSLLKILYGCNGNISYQDLVSKTALLVRNLVGDQNPGLHINGTDEPGLRDQVFLTNVKTTPGSVIVFFDPKWKWCIKQGLIHGVSKGDEVNIEGIGDTQVSGTPAPDFSTIDEIAGLDKAVAVYNATITRQPNQPLLLSFDPAFTGEERSLIEKHFGDSTRATSRIIPEGSGKFIIRKEGAGVFISKPGSTTPLIKPLPMRNVQDVLFFAERVELVSKWISLLELSQSSFESKPYTLSLYQNTIAGNYDPATFKKVEPGDAATDFFYMEGAENEWHQPAFRLSVKNTGTVPLFISNAYLAFDYAITTDFFDEIQLLAPGMETWLTFINDESQEDTILLNLDDKYSSLGYQEITEYLKLLIGTQQIDTDKLKQDGLEMPLLRTKSVEGRSPSPVAARKPANAFSWSAETFGFRIVRPAGKSELAPGNSTSLHSISIAPHASLKAKAVLTSSGLSNRSMDMVTSPDSARQNSFLQPFDLNEGTRSADRLDILELEDVQGAGGVTPEAPLILRTNRGDVSDVIPVGYDKESGMYYPLGFGNAAGEIIIETLPDATPVNKLISTRSLAGSVKIFFQKVIGRRLGLAYTYPRLAIATVNEDLSVNYNSDVAAVSKAVAEAKSIILFVHGIIGDTESILASVRTRFADTAAAKKHDLVLSFDYENLNTEIQENAALLKQKLAAVGLAAGHNKSLTIAAHSMGGLVSRWFIEKLGGNAVVTKLIMLGTPNNGTPWADVRDMAETLLTYAMNGAALLKPWMFVLNLAGKVIGGVQVTLKQMDIKTGIYKTLNDGTDPGIPYLIIAGNTKEIIPAYAETASMVSKLFTRIRKRGAYDALDLLLFKEANDIAVTNKSIVELLNAAEWKVKPEVVYVACDHLNYFGNEEAMGRL